VRSRRSIHCNVTYLERFVMCDLMFSWWKIEVMVFLVVSYSLVVGKLTYVKQRS